MPVADGIQGDLQLLIATALALVPRHARAPYRSGRVAACVYSSFRAERMADRTLHIASCNWSSGRSADVACRRTAPGAHACQGTLQVGTFSYMRADSAYSERAVNAWLLPQWVVWCMASYIALVQ
jgi:hypothetical protein